MISISIVMMLKILLFSLALANGSRTVRIIGGSPAALHEFPYQGILSATLIIRFGEVKYLTQIERCNGAILYSNWILTAAHCVEGMNPPNLRFITEPDSPFNSKMHEVSFIAIHPEYERKPINDIALLRLRKNIPFNDHVQPIALPSANFTNYTLSADFAGWSNLPPYGLQKIKLNFTSDEECEKIAFPYTKKFVCVSHRIDEGPCMDDGGTPLVVNGSVVGISPIIHHCDGQYANKFIRVSSYIDWIKQIIGDNH